MTGPEPTPDDSQQMPGGESGDAVDEMTNEEYEALLAQEFNDGPGRRPTAGERRRIREGLARRRL